MADPGTSRAGLAARIMAARFVTAPCGPFGDTAPRSTERNRMLALRRALFACLALGVFLLPVSCGSKHRGTTGGGVTNPPLPSALDLRTVTTSVAYPIF